MKKKLFLMIIISIILLISISPVFAETYENYDDGGIVSCGSGMVENIPVLIPNIVSTAYKIIQIVVPVVLVIMGSLDLVKGLTAQKEDDVKKGQQMFVKRLIAAALVFFVFVIVKLVISFVADETGSKIMDCAECFVNGYCEYQYYDGIENETIIHSINSLLNDDSGGYPPEYISMVREKLISFIGSDFSGNDEELIEIIEARLTKGDPRLRFKLINYLYYDL